MLHQTSGKDGYGFRRGYENWAEDPRAPPKDSPGQQEPKVGAEPNKRRVPAPLPGVSGATGPEVPERRTYGTGSDGKPPPIPPRSPISPK